MNVHVVRPIVLLFLCAGLTLGAAEGQRGRDQSGGQQPTQNSACNEVPAHPLDLLLGRPTREAVTISALA